MLTTRPRQTRRHLVRGMVVAAILAAAAVAPYGPAMADTQHHRDPRGDVRWFLSGEDEPAADPGVDVVGLSNTYRERRLTMAMTVVDLLPRGWVAEWDIRTDDSLYVLVLDHGGRRPDVGFEQFEGPGTPRSCPDADARVRGDTVVAVVPRRCVAGADEVRVAGVMMRPQGSNTKADDSNRRGLAHDRFRFAFGPVLQRS